MMTADRIPPGQRRQMIAETAYFIAERRGFRGGDPVADWLEAEKEVEKQFVELHDEDPLAHFTERLAHASDRLKALRRKASRATTEARDALRRDAEKLARLRAELEQQLEGIRERGAVAGHKGLERAEKLWKELSELIERAGARRRPPS